MDDTFLTSADLVEQYEVERQWLALDHAANNGGGLLEYINSLPYSNHTPITIDDLDKCLSDLHKEYEAEQKFRRKKERAWFNQNSDGVDAMMYAVYAAAYPPKPTRWNRLKVFMKRFLVVINKIKRNILWQRN